MAEKTKTPRRPPDPLSICSFFVAFFVQSSPVDDARCPKTDEQTLTAGWGESTEEHRACTALHTK